MELGSAKIHTEMDISDNYHLITSRSLDLVFLGWKGLKAQKVNLTTGQSCKNLPHSAKGHFLWSLAWPKIYSEMPLLTNTKIGVFCFYKLYIESSNFLQKFRSSRKSTDIDGALWIKLFLLIQSLSKSAFILNWMLSFKFMMHIIID